MRKLHAKSFELFYSHRFYFPTYGGIAILVVLFLLGAGLGSLASLWLAKFFSPQFIADYSMLIVYPIQFVPLLIYVSGRSVESPDALEIPLDRRGIKAPAALTAAIATLGLAVTIEPLVACLPEMPQALRNAMELLTGGPLWAVLLSAAVMAPVFEEWLCRGIVLRGLLQKLKPAWAIVISALFFAVIHMNPWQAIPAFLLGCLFGYVYYKTGSLRLTMLMHCVNNASSVMLTRLPSTKNCDYLWQAFEGKMAVYYLLYAVAAFAVVATVCCFVKLKKEEI